jgi:hypothetical protein
MTETKKYICGYCITTNHDKCKNEPTYNDKKYSCECFCRTIEYTDDIRDRMIEEFYGR